MPNSKKNILFLNLADSDFFNSLRSLIPHESNSIGNQFPIEKKFIQINIKNKVTK